MYQQQQQYNNGGGRYAPAQQTPQQVQAAKRAGDTLITLIHRQEGELRKALGRAIPVERFIRICCTAVRQTPRLAECTQESFMGAMMTAAQLGLEPNTPQGLCFLVPYGKVCQLQVGYKGLLALMWKSGLVASMNADVVYRQEVENGSFMYESGMEARIVHRISLLDDARSGGPEEIIAAYACAVLKTGQQIVRLVTRAELDDAKAAAQAKKPNTPWNTHYKAMALKTAIKRLAQWVPTSQCSDAIALEDGYAESVDGTIMSVVPAQTGTGTAQGLNQMLDSFTTQQQAAPPQQPVAQQPTQSQPVQEAPKRRRRTKQQILADQQAAMQAQQAQQLQEQAQAQQPMQAQPVQDMAYQQAPAEAVAAEPQQPEEDDPYFTHIKKDIIWPACLQAKVSPGSVITAFRETHGNGCSWDDAILALCEDETDLSVLHQHIQLVKDNPGRYVADPDEDNFF